ncbi:MAG TPA: hypothetical protein PKK59_09450 [Anaerolineaceae bacterium]|nr:hypothetical protein [Anaerolineaceae bacterium]
MNKTLKWVLIGLAIAVGVFIIALPIFTLVLGGGHAGMMDGWGLRDGLRDGVRMPYHSPFMMMPLMGIFGLFRLLLPAAVLGLAVYGVVALARGGRGNNAATPPPPAAAVSCAACGRELVSGGEFCPYCGAKQ